MSPTRKPKRQPKDFLAWLYCFADFKVVGILIRIKQPPNEHAFYQNCLRELVGHNPSLLKTIPSFRNPGIVENHESKVTCHFERRTRANTGSEHIRNRFLVVRIFAKKSKVHMEQKQLSGGPLDSRLATIHG